MAAGTQRGTASPKASTKVFYDVVIVGGGPAGSAVARTLRLLGVESVLLLEAKDYGSVRVGESLPPETRLLLDELGVWQDFLGQEHEPALGSCSIWGSDALGYNDFLFNPHGHGRHLDRRRFDELLARSAEAAGAELRLHTRCVAVRRLAQGLELDLVEADLDDSSGRQTVRARYVVDAAGSAATLARRLGAEKQVHDRLTCVAAFLVSEQDGVSCMTWLEAVENGWWYGARLPGGRAVVAFATDGEIVQSRGLQRPDRFHAELARTRHLAGAFEDCRPSAEPLLIRGAPSFVLDQPWGEDWLAVGDAASSYDPVTSQGIYKALQDGMAAGRAIARHLAGETAALSAYGDGVRDRFREYLAVRNYLYDQERRWADRSFWQLRRARRGVTTARPEHRDSENPMKMSLPTDAAPARRRSVPTQREEIEHVPVPS